MMKLAINGGKKVRRNKFPSYITVGKEEEKAIKRVIKSGVLSKYLGAWHENFYGGPEVKALEKEWAQYFNVKHAIAVNSATSGLYCAVGAAGLGPGDEMIVTPLTMSCSATAALIYNAIPVFADIEEDYFCLSPESVEKRITPRTKAIMVVDFCGQPYDADRINKIAGKHNLIVIEDCAQAPGAKYKGKYAGTLGDIGIYSLNYHKHIHTGEGGIIATDNDELADKMMLIRNHAEAVVGVKGYTSLINMLGFNYRMTEIEAAIGREQLKKLSGLVQKRIENVNYLSEKLLRIPCITPAKTRPGSSHVHYIHAIIYKKEVTNVSLSRFIEAVKAELMPIRLRETEGVRISSGFTPLYLLPLYQQKTAYGEYGCPWKCEKYNDQVDYSKGICPVAERICEDILIGTELTHPSMQRSDLDDVAMAFEKVWEYRSELK